MPSVGCEFANLTQQLVKPRQILVFHGRAGDPRRSRPISPTAWSLAILLSATLGSCHDPRGPSWFQLSHFIPGDQRTKGKAVTLPGRCVTSTHTPMAGIQSRGHVRLSLKSAPMSLPADVRHVIAEGRPHFGGWGSSPAPPETCGRFSWNAKPMPLRPLTAPEVSPPGYIVAVPTHMTQAAPCWTPSS